MEIVALEAVLRKEREERADGTAYLAKRAERNHRAKSVSDIARSRV